MVKVALFLRLTAQSWVGWSQREHAMDRAGHVPFRVAGVGQRPADAAAGTGSGDRSVAVDLPPRPIVDIIVIVPPPL
jgi:hypothetical protein